MAHDSQIVRAKENLKFIFGSTSLLQRKTVLAIPVAMVTIIRNFKNYYFVLELQMYIM